MRSIVFLASLLAFYSSPCAAHSPIGLWRTIDDQSCEPKSLVCTTQAKDGRSQTWQRVEQQSNHVRKTIVQSTTQGNRSAFQQA